MKRPQQTLMFKTADLPLFSGTPQAGAVSHFQPTEPEPKQLTFTVEITMVTNCTPNISKLAAANNGTLPAWAWPGGYPLFYIDAHNNVLCPVCANENDEIDQPITNYEINYESEMWCDKCSTQIKSAYGDD